MADDRHPALVLGTAVRAARKDARLTQQQLADLAGCSDRTLREIEQGSGSPSIGTVIDVLDVLGLRLEAAR